MADDRPGPPDARRSGHRRLVVPVHRRAEIRALAVRSNQVVLFAALVGGCVGAVVAGFEAIVDEAMGARASWPQPVVTLLPLAGLLIAYGIRRVGGRVGPGTADEYLASFHDPTRELRLRDLGVRLPAAVATLSSGAPMGLEGPSIYAGATVGAVVQRRVARRWFRGADHRILLVAGAAAGVASIFRAPATGAVFALEVPYQDDLARRMLLPSLVGAVSGYLVFVSIMGTDPLFVLAEAGGFRVRDLLGAAAVGVIGGAGARVFALLLRRSKAFAVGSHRFASVIAGGAAIAVLVVVADLISDETLVIGSGHHVVDWVLTTEHSVGLLVSILVLRSLATAAAVAAGGVGGVFIPLVVSGALTGAAIGRLVDPANQLLFVVVGIAAFLGAGYRVPLAAVMFVAETTGRPAYVVPGVIAAVVAELMMGRSSVTAYQRAAWPVAADPAAAPDVPDAPDRPDRPDRPDEELPATDAVRRTPDGG
jgi:CIC family chloride channel protein